MNAVFYGIGVIMFGLVMLKLLGVL